MFNLKRNQIIITVLVFMVAIAAYLNTQEGPLGTSPNLVEDNTFNEEEEKDFFEGYDAVSDEGSDTFALEADEASDANVPLETKDNKMAEALPAEESADSFTAVITKKDSEALEAAEPALSTNADTSYFSEEKMLREQSRAQQVEQLSEYVANENLDQESKAKAAENLLQIQERIEKENSAEALLRAKGFSEVYVRIDDDTVDVVVGKSELTDSDIAQIEEIVNRKTGYSVGKINITPLNGVAKQ